MSQQVHSPFLGLPLCNFPNRRSAGIRFRSGHWLRRRAGRRRICAEKQNDWVAHAIRFSNFCGKQVELVGKTIGYRNGFVVKCVKEPFVARSRAIVRSLTPLFQEGLFFIRCSVFLGVLFSVCLLVWYGQKKAKSFVEAKLLPSVCSVLSEHIQRDIDFGKVRRVSPLSITLESCLIGPHNQEFSCGEVPTIKIRVLPFTSLRRGRIVIDAILSHPSVLVAQKKDYTWLGIPFSEGSLQRHLSTEDGIDYRTKARRLSREDAASQWEKDREDAAREAAQSGYIVPEEVTGDSEDDKIRETNLPTELISSKAFICMDEKMHWADHHCMDTGIDYDMKHADLEKSFGVKIPGSGLKFLSNMMKGRGKNKLKRKSNGRETSSDGHTPKRRILERSASAAVNYFQYLSREKPDSVLESTRNYDVLLLDNLFAKSERDNTANVNVEINDQRESSLVDNRHDRKHEGKRTRHNIMHQNSDESVSDFRIFRDPFLVTVKRLGVGTMEKSSLFYSNASSAMCGCSEDGNLPEGSGLRDENLPGSETEGSENHGDGVCPSTAQNSRPHFLGNLKVAFSNLLPIPFQKPKLTSPKVEDILAELVDGVDVVQSEGIEMLPVTVDSLHFKGGTLMLLAFGDREPRCRVCLYMHIYSCVSLYMT